ncbi:uncharacterized protein LOC124686682 isoform X2 [Lolium rigidum]|uniref:uncharacterized protein LOC124686682 isoform X2 n=1 Tax=Lolium rigidum TaxID=89674 RepID=UPI001F5D2D19|nr:uncharacterized protein LOC124686682 isoform X2 [Lolium rigidum]
MQTAVIDGEDWLSPRFREMLVGDHLGYNVENCRMTEVGKLQWEHDDTMDCLHEALFDCKDEWIQGWEVDRHNWRYNHPIALGRRCRDYNSGVYAMHYALMCPICRLSFGRPCACASGPVLQAHEDAREPVISLLSFTRLQHELETT